MNLVDLLSEKHLVLRKTVTDRMDEPMNKTESHILAVLENQPMLSISEISRMITISRQGTHKSIQGLLARAYVEIVDVQGRVRDKHLVITPKGRECNQRMLVIKEELEQEITARLAIQGGPDQEAASGGLAIADDFWAAP